MSGFHAPPPLIVCRQAHKATALKEYTGQYFRNASRHRLARMRRFTALSDEATVEAPGTDQTDYGERFQVGAPFATLFEFLFWQRNEHATYVVGVLSETNSTTKHRYPGRIMGGQVMNKQHIMELLVGGDDSRSSGRRESCAERPPLPYPLNVCDRTRPGHERE